MQWYVLFVLASQSQRLASNLNKRSYIEAFVPMYEFYNRSIKEYAIKPMFNSYVFIKTELGQCQFSDLLRNMEDEKKGLIKQLKHCDVSALREEEKKMFELLLDSTHILRVSKAYIKDGKAVVYEGPLQYFEDCIVKVDKHNQLAYLALSFMDRRIKAGLKITDMPESHPNFNKNE